MILISINFFIFLAITGWLYWMVFRLKKSLKQVHEDVSFHHNYYKNELEFIQLKVNGNCDYANRRINDHQRTNEDKFKGLEDKIESIKHKKK